MFSDPLCVDCLVRCRYLFVFVDNGMVNCVIIQLQRRQLMRNVHEFSLVCKSDIKETHCILSNLLFEKECPWAETPKGGG